MSQDQRPGRVRVVSSGVPAAPAQRRRGDRETIPSLPPETVDLAPAPAGQRVWVSALLFLSAAAISGALATYYDLIGVLAR